MNYCKVLIFLIASFVNAQQKQFVTFLSDEVQINKETTFITVIIPFEILQGYHIQLEKVESDNLLATKINFEKQSDIEIIDKEFTSLQLKSVILDKIKFQVLNNDFKVKVKLVANKKSTELRGKLFYQTCDDFMCYFPRELKFSIPLKTKKLN